MSSSPRPTASGKFTSMLTSMSTLSVGQTEYCFAPRSLTLPRRNGKTYVTSGTAAALLLCVPNIKIAIFSTCKRTSQMMMSAIMDMLDMSFERGTHVSRQDYITVTKNTESVCFEGPDRTKRMLGSFPGSVRVSDCLDTLHSFFPALALVLGPMRVGAHLVAVRQLFAA